MSVHALIVKCSQKTKHTILHKVTANLEILDTEFYQFIFT